jgi:hypothetical protein
MSRSRCTSPWHSRETRAAEHWTQLPHDGVNWWAFMITIVNLFFFYLLNNWCLSNKSNWQYARSSEQNFMRVKFCFPTESSEGREFESRWGHFIFPLNLRNPSSRNMVLGLVGLVGLCGVKQSRSVNLTASLPSLCRSFGQRGMTAIPQPPNNLKIFDISKEAGPWNQREL